MKLLEEWARNYHAVVDSPESEEADTALEAYKATEDLMRALPKSARKVLRMRYIELASWEGIGKLYNMRPARVEEAAWRAERMLASLTETAP